MVDQLDITDYPIPDQLDIADYPILTNLTSQIAPYPTNLTSQITPYPSPHLEYKLQNWVQSFSTRTKAQLVLTNDVDSDYLGSRLLFVLLVLAPTLSRW